MSISGVAAVGGASTSSSSNESQIARLRKQETEINKQLRDLASSDTDAKTKETKQQLLSAQLQGVEAQIAQLSVHPAAATQPATQASAAAQPSTAVQQAATEAAAQQAAATKAESATDAAEARAVRPIDGNGYQVDVEL